MDSLQRTGLKLINHSRPVSTFQAYFQRVLKSARNPGSLFTATENTVAKTAEHAAENPQGVLSSLRSLSRAQVISGAVIGAELLGFFTVGEIIGRMKLVGYRGDDGAAHH